MAKYIIPPKGVPLVRCSTCKTLYSPEKMRFPGSMFFEACPVCGCESNGMDQLIPLWRYNLIKWFRGGFRKQQ